MSKFVTGKLYICVESLYSVPPERGGPVIVNNILLFVKEEEFPLVIHWSDKIKYIFMSKNQVLTLYFDKETDVSGFFKPLNDINKDLE